MRISWGRRTKFQSRRLSRPSARVGLRSVDSQRPASDQDVSEDRAEEAVEHDRLGEGEAEPLDSGQLASQLRLARDGLNHRGKDVANADAGAEGTETHAK